ncbi:hypothetical protein ACT6QH_02075 [Xanthobacter sp. TB0139]|uniref:hypothetical protein n=1 Tax=Xanthobacter sp. TB0139 TaxID=3459178 RepID=UPI0040397ED4
MFPRILLVMIVVALGGWIWSAGKDKAPPSPPRYDHLDTFVHHRLPINKAILDAGWDCSKVMHAFPVVNPAAEGLSLKVYCQISGNPQNAIYLVVMNEKEAFSASLWGGKPAFEPPPPETVAAQAKSKSQNLIDRHPDNARTYTRMIQQFDYNCPLAKLAYAQGEGPKGTEIKVFCGPADRDGVYPKTVYKVILRENNTFNVQPWN